MPKFLFSILISVNIFIFSLLPLFVSESFAQSQTPWYSQDPKSWYIRVYGSPDNDVFGERYTAAQVQWIFYGIWANILNAMASAVGVTPKDLVCVYQTQPFTLVCGLGKIIDTFKKLLGATTGGGGRTPILFNNSDKKGVAELILFEDRPVSGISYIRNVGRNLHLVSEAKAQNPGFGYQVLNPIQTLWRASRNFAYAILVFAFLIMSFMIMFRVKINPQTVITVQSAIPKVAIALVLITFSYAIAGFIVDAMYIVIGIFSFVFSEAWRGVSVLSFAVTPTNMFNWMTAGPGGGGVIGALIILLAPALLLTILLIFVGALIGGTVVGSLFGLVMVVIGLLILVVVFIFFLKVLWTLLKAFAYVILLIALGPLQIAIGVLLPTFGFGQWLKSLIANLAVFPLTGVFIALSFYFTALGLQLLQPLSIAAGLLTPGGPWPPLLSLGGLGLGGTISVAITYFAVSMVILAVLPKVSDIIKSVIEGKPFAFGTAIGEALGPTRAIGRAGGLYGAAEYMNAAQRIAENVGEPTPGWVQAGRKILGLRP